MNTEDGKIHVQIGGQLIDSKIYQESCIEQHIVTSRAVFKCVVDRWENVSQNYL